MTRRVLGIAGSAALAVVAVVVLLPRVTQSPWAAIGGAWRSLTWWQVALLCLLWGSGLLVHSTMLMAVLPGLTRRRAMTLNLTGSAMANVVPLGGGAGIGLNYLMVRVWGFSPGQFSLFTLLSNLLHLLCKAVLPVVAVVLLLASATPIGHRVLVVAVGTSTLLAAMVTTCGVLFSSDRGARVAGATVARIGRWTRTRRDVTRVEQQLRELRRNARSILQTGWQRMTISLLGYYALGATLMWACFHALGSSLGVAAVLVLFAFERALTALPITPGGSGVVEIATTALATTLAGPHDSAVLAAGVLLYRAFAFGLEIPIGGVWLVGWLVARRFGHGAASRGRIAQVT
jgi:putative heme transporter